MSYSRRSYKTDESVVLFCCFLSVFFFKQKTAYEIGVRLVGSEMCIRDRAHDMLCLLHAFAEPGVERVLTALRATRLMAATLSELCDQDEQARSDLRERLEAGVARWRRAGAAAALSAFIDEEHLAERLLPVEGGEQRLTNYAHIIELLNEAGRKYATPAGLLSWFESARAQKLSLIHISEPTRRTPISYAVFCLKKKKKTGRKNKCDHP